MTELLPIVSIRTNGGAQPRAQMNPVMVASYAEDMTGGADFPPIIIFYDGLDYWLADGFHRLEAARQIRRETIPADVRQGTRRDAVLYSVGANATHGLRRTNEDKRRAVMTLLNDSEWVQWSDREIARQCAVSSWLVSDARRTLSARFSQIGSGVIVSRNGRNYVMNTDNIGKTSPFPALPPQITFDAQHRDDTEIVYRYQGGYAYCKYCYTTHEKWELAGGDYDSDVWRCKKCNHTIRDRFIELADKPPSYADDVVSLCWEYGVDEVKTIAAWQQVYERNHQAFDEAWERGHIVGLDGIDVAISDADATLVLIAADEDAYERAMRQRAYIAEKNARKAQRREEKQERKEAVPEIITRDAYQLYTGDLMEVAIDDQSIDWIITDPPYPKEFVPEYRKLAEFAARVLRPGGSLLVMCGQSYLPEIMQLMTSCLNYHWTLAYLTPGGQSVQLWDRHVNTFWKPVLWFVNGDYTGDWIGDVSKSAVNDNDKRFHEWGQSESGMGDLVERFTYPGETILDPFMGAGTTGVVAVRGGRQFIGIDIDPACVAVAEERLCQIIT